MAKASGVEQLIIEALERALADPMPRKMHGTRANPGIFLSASAASKTAALRCVEQALVRQVAEQRTGKRATPLFTITPAGIALVVQRSPVPRLLAAMLDATQNMAKSVAQCGQALQTVAQQVEGLRGAFEQVAGRIQPPDMAKILHQVSIAAPVGSTATPDRAAGLDEQLTSFVRACKARTPLQPVEFPALFRHASAQFAALSIGQFHDAVRRLAGQKRLRLLPYTQAMYQLAEPEFALIVGREVMYYAEPGANSTT